MHNLEDAKKEVAKIDDAMLISRMKYKNSSYVKATQSENYHNLYPKKMPLQNKVEKKEEKPSSPFLFHYKNLMIFNQRDFQTPHVVEGRFSNSAGAYHLHVEYDNEHIS